MNRIEMVYSTVNMMKLSEKQIYFVSEKNGSVTAMMTSISWKVLSRVSNAVRSYNLKALAQEKKGIDAWQYR